MLLNSQERLFDSQVRTRSTCCEKRHMKVNQEQERQLIMICGARLWCYRQAAMVASELDALGNGMCISKQLRLAEADNLHHIHHVLGTECDWLVFDGFDGVDANLLGTAVGTLVGGGVLLWLMPELDDYQCAETPLELQANFLNRALRLINQFEGTQWWRQSSSEHFFEQWRRPVSRQRPLHLTEQDNLLITLWDHYEAGNTSPVFLTADRGRGKSAALGRFLGELINRSPALSVAITAPNRRNIQTLMRFYEETTTSEHRLSFYPPDQLLALSRDSSTKKLDLLVVDEAAAIPAPILDKCLGMANWVIFSSTVHGYEGAGRAFTLRFQQRLKKQFPNLLEAALTSPIRWSDTDGMEPLFNSILGLFFDEQPVYQSALEHALIRYRAVSKAELLADECLLKQVFGLLVAAHYQTTPSDFCFLLDGKHSRLYVGQSQARVVAVAMIVEEGQWSAEFTEDVIRNQRRPIGHRLPQTHYRRSLDANVLSQSYWRIMRIAVAHDCQNNGIGHSFVKYIESKAKELNINYVGTSFGATPKLSRFWLTQNYIPVHLGFRKEQASGCYSLVLLKSLMGTPIKGRLARSELLASPAKLRPQIEHGVIETVAASCVAEGELNHQRIQAFVDGYLAFNDIYWELETLLRGGKTQINNGLLLDAVMHSYSTAELCQKHQLAGKKALKKALREAVDKVLATGGVEDKM